MISTQEHIIDRERDVPSHVCGEWSSDMKEEYPESLASPADEKLREELEVAEEVDPRLGLRVIDDL